MFALMFFLSFAASAAEIPQQVSDRLSYIIRLEAQAQMQSEGSSEDAAFEAVERRLMLLEQSLTLATANKADKFDKLIEFFREKMIYKCCQLAGKGGRGSGRGGGGGGGGGGGRRRGGGG